MTYTIKELESHPQLSMTYFELQARVAKLGEVNSGWASKSGKRGSWIVSDVGFQVLLRLKTLEEEGSSVKAGLEQIDEELSETKAAQVSASETILESNENSAELEHLREKLEMQEAIIADLRSDKERQQDIIDRLTLALPAPKLKRSEKGIFSRIAQMTHRLTSKVGGDTPIESEAPDPDSPTIDI